MLIEEIISKNDWKLCKTEKVYKCTKYVRNANKKEFLFTTPINEDGDLSIRYLEYLVIDSNNILIKIDEPVDIKIKYFENIQMNPIGITPKDIWLKKRKQEILDAIIRYTESGVVIPVEWVKELKELEMRGM